MSLLIVFVLYQLSKKLNEKEIGLYGGDGLAIYKSKTGSRAEIIKYDFQENLSENDLNIVIKLNLKIVDYIRCHTQPSQEHLQTFLEHQKRNQFYTKGF